MKKVLISGLMIALACVAGAETVTNNLDVQGGFIYNHGFINPGSVTNGYTFTNAGIRDLTISAGQLGGVDPETGAAITNKDNLVLIKAQSIRSVSNIVADGIFIGDGSGLTNLNAESLSGSISTSQFPTSGVWNASGLLITNPVLAGQIQVDGETLNISTNLNVEGVISGDASGLTGIPAGGNDGDLQFNDNGVLSGNTNYFIHPDTGKLSFNAPEGYLFRGYTGSVADESLIYSVRNENGLSVVRLLKNTNENIRLTGDGDATFTGDLQIGGTLFGDGSGLTNLATQALDNRYIQQTGGIITGTLQVVGQILGDASGLTNLPPQDFGEGYFIGENQVLYSTIENHQDILFAGVGAGEFNTNTEVVAVGAYAGQYASGESGVYVGQDAGQYSTGERVVLIGEDAGQCSTGIYVVAIGEKAGRYNTGDYTVMLMRDAGYNNSGSHSLLIGQDTGRNNSGDYAHLIGQNAGRNNAGTNVLFIGNYAGRNNTGSRVIGLGKKAGYNNTADDRLFIDINTTTTNTLIYGEFDNNLIRINGDLDVTGTLTGNGSGLTGLDASKLTGTINTERLPTSGAWDASNLTISNLTVEGDGSGLTNVNAVRVGGLTGENIISFDHPYQPVFSNGIVSFQPVLPREGMIQWLDPLSDSSWLNRLGSEGARLVGSHCAMLDGAGDVIQIDNSAALFNFGTNDFTVEGWIDIPVDDNALHMVVSKYSTTDSKRSWGLAIEQRAMTSEIRIYTSDDGSYAGGHGVIAAAPLPSAGWHYIKATKSGTSVVWEVDGASISGSGLACETVYTSPAPVLVGAQFSIAEGTKVAFWSGGIAEIKITGAGQIAHYTFSEGAGTTVYDVSGNGHHGTLTTADTGAFRAGTQDKFHYNLLNGFTKSGEIYIPALTDHSGRDALGNMLSVPSGNGHNNAETKIMQQADNAELKAADADNFWYNNGVPKEISYDNLLTVNSARIFADTSVFGLVQSIRTYNVDLEGEALALAQNYPDNAAGQQINMHAENGFCFIGGPIAGDGSGLTNLNVVTTETDPVFVASAAAGITTNNITGWNSGADNTLFLDGSREMGGNLNMGGNGITHISTNALVYADGQSVRQTYVDVAGDTMVGALTLQTNLFVHSQVIIGSVEHALDVVSNALPESLIVEGDISTAGKYFGDGSGLTQLNVTNLIGMISTNRLPSEALQSGGGVTNVDWGVISGTLTNQSDLVAALAAKADSTMLADVATTGDYNDLTNTPVLAAIATEAAYSNLTVNAGEIEQTLVNGLTNDLAGKLAVTWTNSVGTMAYAETNDYVTVVDAANYVEKSAVTNVLAGALIAETNLTVQGTATFNGAFYAAYIPEQGDLSMGSYTNRP